MSHECKRFKTVRKSGGIRLTVRCRECGRLVVTEAARQAEAMVEAARVEAYGKDMAEITQGNVA
jgi:hypothetical protein